MICEGIFEPHEGIQTLQKELSDFSAFQQTVAHRYLGIGFRDCYVFLPLTTYSLCAAVYIQAAGPSGLAIYPSIVLPRPSCLSIKECNFSRDEFQPCIETALRLVYVYFGGKFLQTDSPLGAFSTT